MVTSNRESGFGRYDVMLEPRAVSDVQGNGISLDDDAVRDAIIIEFKVQDEEEKELSDTVQEALRQIEKKDYRANLVARGFSEEHIRRYGFAFCGKRVLIGGGKWKALESGREMGDNEERKLNT